MDNCGIPNKANWHVHAVIGRDIMGGTETDYSDIYVCDEHMPADIAEQTGIVECWMRGFNEDAMRSLFQFDGSDDWYVVEYVVSKLR